MSGYEMIFPEALLLVGALIALFCPSSTTVVQSAEEAGQKSTDAQTTNAAGAPTGQAAAWVGFVFAAAAAIVAICLPTGDGGAFASLLTYDAKARLACGAIGILGALWLLWTAGARQTHSREAVALALFATMGGMFLATSFDLVCTFVSLELATLPVYVLIGYRKDRLSGLEGALKFFLLSMMLTLITLYGFSFLFGLSGTTAYSGISIEGSGLLGLLALLFSLVGIFAKLSAVPFHFWAPDAYEGSTSWAVAFVATVPKIGGAVALVRLVEATAFKNPEALFIVALVGAASMILGNLAALPQNDVRRLMAYSAIAHTGYMMLGLLAASVIGSLAVVIYSVVYSFASMAVLLGSAQVGPAISDFNGLVRRSPALSWGLVVALLSLIGIPPLAGFFGKLTLFTSALSQGWIGMVIIAVVMSIVSVAYYLKIVKASFFGENLTAAEMQENSTDVNTEGVCQDGGRPICSKIASLAFWLCIAGVFLLGIGFSIMLKLGGALW